MISKLEVLAFTRKKCILEVLAQIKVLATEQINFSTTYI
jgi:hypothetical protein